MDKEEFLKRLNENKYNESVKEHIEYRLPVLQYYIENYLKNTFATSRVDGSGPYQLSMLKILNPEEDDYNFRLMNEAFDTLISRKEKLK